MTGEDLARHRRDLGYTQAEFAQLAGISVKTLYQYEAHDLVEGRTRRFCADALERARSKRRPASNAEDFPWLRLSTERWNPENCGPAALLRPEYEVVPFHGKQRLNDLETLSRWCKDPRRFSVRAFTADGGFGKSRLGRELCHHVRNIGWIAGFAEPEDFHPGRKLDSAIEQLKTPILIVVDYAGDREKVPMLHHIIKSAGSSGAKFRLLILDREQWWLTRLESLLGTNDRLSAAGLINQEWKLTLEPAAQDESERRKSFRLAAIAFSDRLKVPPLDPPSDLVESDVYKNILMIHARALVLQKGNHAPSRDTRILSALLDRERNYWRKRLEAVGSSRLLLQQVEEAQAIINFCGGARSKSVALQWLNKYKPFRRVSSDIIETILSVLRECYPLGATGIGPVQPDLLREHFQEATLEKYPMISEWIKTL